MRKTSEFFFFFFNNKTGDNKQWKIKPQLHT